MFQSPPTKGFANDMDRLKFTLDAAGIGMWEWDLHRRTVLLDECCCTSLGLAAVVPAMGVEKVLRLIHREDRAAVLQCIKKAMQGPGGQTLDFRCRVGGTNGQLRWLRVTGTSYLDEKGGMTRLGGVARDVTEKCRTQSKARHTRAQTLSLLHEMPVAVAVVSRADFVFTHVNRLYCELVGYEPEMLVGKSLLTVFPDARAAGLEQVLQQVADSGEPFTLNAQPLVLAQKEKEVSLYVNFSFQAVWNEAGAVTDLLLAVGDVTPQVVARKKMEASEARFQNLIQNASVGIILLLGKEMRIETVNEAYSRLVGHSVAQLLHQPIFEVLPEAAAYYRPIIEKVRVTGEETHLFNTPYRVLNAQGTPQSGYLNVVYQPYREAENEPVTGVLILLYDVTEQALAAQKAAESEAKFRSLIAEAPFATSLYIGPELVIDLANDAMIRLWGKTPAVIGQPLEAALPELEGQPFIGLLQEVFRTGVAYRAQAQEAKLVVDGLMQSFWFNFIYKPLLNAAGEVYAILNMAVDVTEQVVARKRIDESESNLAAAIELAELGTWSMEIPSGKMMYSPRLQKWLGIKAAVIENGVSTQVHEKDRERVAAAIQKAIAPNGPGRYDEVYTILHAVTGAPRVIHATGRVHYDAQGSAIRLSGTAQDITLQRDLQSALENEVQLRTEQLDEAFQKLQETNDALAGLNEKLKYSNEELAQYAYVASHDLQEPLRKIQIFSDLLQSDKTLSEKNQGLVEKIVASSARMSQLIRDLLNFSRLMHPDKQFQSVDLNAIVASVRNDYELIAEEKNAQFHVAPLPTVEAIPLQMSQLFYNLIGNSLKFTRPGVPPLITITATVATDAEVAQCIRVPQPAMVYQKIAITDNGIGFEEDYSEKIFEVFKRLHTREAYPGSGIGLALCRRITANHGGALYNYATPGEGATFCVILPQKPELSALQTDPDLPSS